MLLAGIWRQAGRRRRAGRRRIVANEAGRRRTMKGRGLLTWGGGGGGCAGEREADGGGEGRRLDKFRDRHTHTRTCHSKGSLARPAIFLAQPRS